MVVERIEVDDSSDSCRSSFSCLYPYSSFQVTDFSMPEKQHRAMVAEADVAKETKVTSSS